MKMVSYSKNKSAKCSVGRPNVAVEERGVSVLKGPCCGWLWMAACVGVNTVLAGLGGTCYKPVNHYVILVR